MNRCIYAENLQKRINTHLEKLDVPENINSFDKAFIAGMRYVQEMIDSEPTIDSVKQGEWISEKCNHKPYRIKNPEKWVIYKCSVCGYSNGRKQSNYCENCGAKMNKDVII